MMKKRVLVIDDNLATLLLIENFSKKLVDVKFDFANDPLYGLKSFQSFLNNGGVYDLIIIDIIIPYLSGLDLIEIIHTFAPNCKIMVITAVDVNSDIFEYLDDKVQFFLQKPIGQDDFVDTLSEALELVK